MKKKLFLTISIACLLIFVQFFEVKSPPYSIIDPINDVRHYQNTTLISTGDFHDEIDITEFIVNALDMILLFDGTPLYSANYIYVMNVFWDGDSNSNNRSFTQFSGGTINYAGTYLYDDQGIPIVVNITQSSIVIIGDSLKTRIPSFSLITDILNPQYVSVHASYIDGQNYYSDNLTDGEVSTGPTTNGTPGYQVSLVISGLSLMILVRVYVRRRK